MVRKRLIGVITIRNGWAVQSFGYQRYLPLGKPECLAENLDRWGVDEILIQCIDRSVSTLGPDIELIHKIAATGIATPLIYAGGISSADEAVETIRAGADRICVDQLLHTNPRGIYEIAHRLGAQAIIAAFPLILDQRGQSHWYDYRQKSTEELSQTIRTLIDEKLISEALLIDSKHEGFSDAFDFNLTELFTDFELSLILFGGLNTLSKVDKALNDPSVSAIAIGHFLSYKEHTVQMLKQQLQSNILRAPYFHQESIG